jgi:4-diphosphocytidyl-2-C-methyl-D-erythritol kinase
LSLTTIQSSPFTIRAPAKLNLCLKVTGKRPDEYHDLISIMIPIDLCDVLRLKLTSQNQVRLSCEGFSVPTGEENLACRAAHSFFTHTGIQKGLTIKLTKNIPVAAGLGGGSSDAAATLFVINEICGRPLSLSELHALAVELGADVPFFLESKPSLAAGIGEILEPLEKWPKFWYVIVKPPLQVSSSWAYRNLKLELTRGEYDFIVKTLKSDPFRVSDLLNNDLERVTAAKFPIIESIKIRLMEVGAEGALMSGSGPSVFGVFSSLDQAEKARKSLISQNLGDVFVVTDWKRPQPSKS